MLGWMRLPEIRRWRLRDKGKKDVNPLPTSGTVVAPVDDIRALIGEAENRAEVDVMAVRAQAAVFERALLDGWKLQEDDEASSALETLIDSLSSPLVVKVVEGAEGKNVVEKIVREDVFATSDTSGSTKFVRRDLTLQELINMRAACQWWYMHCPFAKVVPWALRSYVIGRGIQFSCPDEQVKEVLMGIWTHEQNSMERRVKKLFWHWLMDGEVAVLLADDPDAILRVRTLSVDEITGIVRDNDDNEVTYLYLRENMDSEYKFKSASYLDYRQYFSGNVAPDQEKFDQKTDLTKYVVKEKQCVVFCPWDSEGMTNGRGIPLLFSILKRLRWVQNFQRDRMLAHRIATQHMITVTVTGNTHANETLLTTRKTPRPGEVLVNTQDRVWGTLSVDTNALDADVDYRALLRSMAVAYMMPEYLFSGDASNNNYASIRHSDTPFTQFVLALQDDFGDGLIFPLLRGMIMAAVKAGKLPETVQIEGYTKHQLGEALKIYQGWLFEQVNTKEPGKPWDTAGLVALQEEVAKQAKNPTVTTIKTLDIPLSLIFPEMVRPDPKALAEAMQIWRNLGVVSRQTSCEKAGFDWGVEVQRLNDEAMAAAARRADELKTFQQSGVIPPGDVPNPPAG